MRARSRAALGSACTEPPRSTRRNRWGRVGEERNAQNALRGPMTLDAAKKDFVGKFKDEHASSDGSDSDDAAEREE